MAFITYHKWAELNGYVRNDNWLDLPDAKKMMRRRDKLIFKEMEKGLTPEEEKECASFDDYWMLAFEYGLSTVDEVVKFRVNYFMEVTGEGLDSKQKLQTKNSFEAEVRMKYAELDDYITKKHWNVK
jgi:hypothetical protein